MTVILNVVTKNNLNPIYVVIFSVVSSDGSSLFSQNTSAYLLRSLNNCIQHD